MAIVNGYATQAQLSEKLGLDTGKQNRYQELLDDSVNRSSRIIDTSTQSFFFKKTITDELVDVNGLSDSGFKISPRLTTIDSAAPIISISSIEENGIALSEKTSFSGDGDFYLKKLIGQIFKLTDGCIWSDQVLGVKLSGEIGYESVPSDISEVCLTFAVVLTRLDTAVVTTDDGSVEGALNSILPGWPFKILKKYNRVIV